MAEPMLRADRLLLGRNLDRAMRIAAMVNDWSEARRAPLRQILSGTLSRTLRRIENGEITARQVVEAIRNCSDTQAMRPSPKRASALADDLVLIFLTALSHRGSSQLGPMREYTFQCVHRIMRAKPQPGQAARGAI